MSWVRVPPEAAHFFLGKVTALSVLCYFALFVCLTLLASFFLSFSSLIKNVYMYTRLFMHSRIYTRLMSGGSHGNGILPLADESVAE